MVRVAVRLLLRDGAPVPGSMSRTRVGAGYQRTTIVPFMSGWNSQK